MAGKPKKALAPKAKPVKVKAKSKGSKAVIEESEEFVPPEPEHH